MLAVGRHKMWAILAWISAAALSPVALKYFINPHLWIYVASSVALFLTAAASRKTRALWSNLACIALGLATMEYYFWTSGYGEFRHLRVDKGNAEERMHAPHDELGWMPEPGTVARHRRLFKGELLYDVTYTIGENGLRISSPPTDDHYLPLKGKCILFFGDSFTFGQGLEDHQTLPFLVNAKAGSRTYNFGVRGYGAHQMLSSLRHGLTEVAVRCKPTQVSHIFYQAITDHIARSAGPAWGWTHGPRYRLTPDGEVRFDGHFEDDSGEEEGKPLTQLFKNQITKSRIYKAIINSKYIMKYPRKAIDLYVGIVYSAEQLALSEYPCAEFHVLLWDEDKVDNRAIREGLRQKGIELWLMSDILPNYQLDDVNERYILHEKDLHPNALATELIAEYVVREILPQPDRCDISPLAADYQNDSC